MREPANEPAPQFKPLVHSLFDAKLLEGGYVMRVDGRGDAEVIPLRSRTRWPTSFVTRQFQTAGWPSNRTVVPSSHATVSGDWRSTTKLRNGLHNASSRQ